MAMDADTRPASASIPDHLVHFANTDGSRVPLDVYRSQEIYDREQERIFRGPTWSFLALEAELPNPGQATWGACNGHLGRRSERISGRSAH